MTIQPKGKLAFTKKQLEYMEDYYHETTLWYCDLCGNWFEYKDDLINHYQPKIIENIFDGDEPAFDLYCDHSAGGQVG